MSSRIVYGQPTRYYVDDREVGEEEYRRLTVNRERLADMLSSGIPPGCRTDSTFLHGNVNGNQFENQAHIGDAYKKKADKAGVSVTGKKYLSSLARYAGDPEAWVSGRGDVERVVRERGWSCEGAVNVDATNDVPVKEKKRVRLAEDIVQRKMAESLAVNPEQKDLGELRHKIIEKHGRK